MKSIDSIPHITDRKSVRSCLCGILPLAAFIIAVFFLVVSLVSPEYKEIPFRWGVAKSSPASSCKTPFRWVSTNSSETPSCKKLCRPAGSEALPEGIVAKTSSLQMRPLWGFPKSENVSTSLFTSTVGIKQKDLVDKMVRKFLSRGFLVMLFHYDGIVDKWKNFEWSDQVIHISAHNQTKWWFAKRFLHPDIVSEYDYIFLWDEDLGVEDFDPKRYLSIVKSEGLEISQPALDPSKSEVHHQITARGRKSMVHRRIFKHAVNGTGCDGHSKAPPCTGWIEMMAPVFSQASWRCIWHMIQNDLIHAWGLDMQLGYCAQGDRTKKIGVVDAEYIVHYNRPTLGGKVEDQDEKKMSPHHRRVDPRVEVRRQSYIELEIFRNRWIKAAQDDKCWIDPYQ